MVYIGWSTGEDIITKLLVAFGNGTPRLQKDLWVDFRDGMALPHWEL